jgi:hypothetical protein
LGRDERRRTAGAPQAIAVALSFCRLLGLGCPKQAFAKIATLRIVSYGKHSQKLYWDGQLWLPENPHSRETGIFGADIYDIARTFKEVFKKDFV